MLKRIRYQLLRRLLDDICLKSDCENCTLCYKAHIDLNDAGSILEGPACLEDDVFRQARKVWGLEE